jgi:hypothetical protein
VIEVAILLHLQSATRNKNILNLSSWYEKSSETMVLKPPASLPARVALYPDRKGNCVHKKFVEVTHLVTREGQARTPAVPAPPSLIIFMASTLMWYKHTW